jgi:uncharacterized membrane protein
MLAGGGLGFVVPMFDSATGGSAGIFTASDSASARGLLETIATVTVSVAGIAFSVTVVALQLASQQLGPRVLRTFQSDRLNQATLAVFLGVFVYSLIALARLSTITLDEGVSSPNAVLTIGVVASILAFGLFAAFIQNAVVSLQASTIIRRMAADGSEVVKSPYPGGIGTPVDGSGSTGQDANAAPRALVRARRAGYLNSLAGDDIIAAATACEGSVTQRVAIGEFVIAGTALAEVGGAQAERLARETEELVDLGEERTLVQDIGFPIRQLVDVALRALSPSLNDPTTAENAMGSVAHVLSLVIRSEPAALRRAGDDGEVRFIAIAPSSDELVRLGFEQVELHSRSNPVFRRRIVTFLEELKDVARAEGAPSGEIESQLQSFAG